MESTTVQSNVAHQDNIGVNVGHGFGVAAPVVAGIPPMVPPVPHMMHPVPHMMPPHHMHPHMMHPPHYPHMHHPGMFNPSIAGAMAGSVSAKLSHYAEDKMRSKMLKRMYRH